MCKTEIAIEIEQQGVDKYGERLPTYKWSGKCNFQNKGKSVLTAEKKLIQLSGCALIPGDIIPELDMITGGTIKVFGNKMRIFEGTKARNPDGTVNYTRLDVE